MVLVSRSVRGTGGPSALEPKVFGIGLARTGTTSLHRAFGLLGIPSAPTSVELMALLDDPSAAVPLLERHRGFVDNPVPFVFETLDARCPGARFVMTTRPKDEWLASMRWLFGPGLDRLDPPTRRLGDEVHARLYGITRFDADVLSTVYDEHRARVARHFAGRARDLLVIELAGLGWEPLCRFLEIEPPATRFPHDNRRRRSWFRRWSPFFA